MRYLRDMQRRHLVDGAQGGGVVVEVVAVDSESGAQLHKHVSDAAVCPPPLQPGLQISLEHPAARQI